MKKLCLLLALIAVVATSMLSGCEKERKDISELRTDYYCANDDNYTLTAVSGVREEEYVADGVVGELREYTLFTVVPEVFDVDAIITYTVVIDNSSFGGNMIVHPFAGSFSAEIDKRVVGGELFVKLAVGGQAYEYTLHSQVGEKMISAYDALELAESRLAVTGEYEVRVKLIKNPIDGDGLCWHVEFIFDKDNDCGILIDPITLKTIATQTK